LCFLFTSSWGWKSSQLDRDLKIIYLWKIDINDSFIVLDGELTTVMAGLNCGTPSDLGWPILRDSAQAFLSCQDEVTFTGMRQLYSQGNSQITFQDQPDQNVIQ
jgi:hypothetical protein